MQKARLLHTTIERRDIKAVNIVPIIETMERTVFLARDLARAARIVDKMISDKDCGV